MNPSVHAGRPRSLVLPSSEDALSLGPEYTPHGLGWIRLLWHALRAEGRSVHTSFFARASRGGALGSYVFFCTRFARRGSAPLPRGRQSCKAVSSEVCGGSAPTPPGLFGCRYARRSRIGLGWCGGAEPLCALSHYAS